MLDAVMTTSSKLYDREARVHIRTIPGGAISGRNASGPWCYPSWVFGMASADFPER